MTYVPLILMLVLTAAVLSVVLLRRMAGHLLRPPRMTDAKALYILQRLTPQDLGLPYQPCHFEVQDRSDGKTLHLSGWWIDAPTDSDQTVVILHGYSDAKVGGIAWAPVWRSLGFHVLAIDLRAHGESDGTYSTAGFYERHDVCQVLDQIRQRQPRQTRSIVIFGVSLGATVAAAVGCLQENLTGVVMESPYDDYKNAITTHGRRLAMPLEWGYPIAYRWAQRLSRADFDQVKPIDLIPKVRCALLVIHSGADTFVSPDQQARIDQSLSKRPASLISRSIIIPEVQHTRGLLKDPLAYRDLLKQFMTDIQLQHSHPTVPFQP